MVTLAFPNQVYPATLQRATRAFRNRVPTATLEGVAAILAAAARDEGTPPEAWIPQTAAVFRARHGRRRFIRIATRLVG